MVMIYTYDYYIYDIRLSGYRNIMMVEELGIEIILILISRNEKKISGLTFIFLARWRYMRYLTKSNVNMKHSDSTIREEH